MGSYGIFIIVGLVILSGVLRSYYKLPKGRHVVDGLILQSPSSPTDVKNCSRQFSRTMATLIASGVPFSIVWTSQRTPPAMRSSKKPF